MNGPENILRLCIFGSCVSRDAIEFLMPEDGIVLAEYYARSALASAFHPEPVKDRFSERISSAFQRRQVQRDFRRSFATSLPDLAFDILLVDFTDERFRLFELADGRLVTVSAELRRAAFPSGLRGRFIEPFGEDHFRLWEAGWRRLVTDLAARGHLDRLRINHAPWAERTEAGSRFAAPNTPELIAAANAHFEILVQRALQDIAPSQVYRYETALLQGKIGHRWGAAPFHYVDAFYRQTLGHLRAEQPERRA